METNFVKGLTNAVNEKEIVGKVKPTQVPQVKNGEQSPLQSLSW